MNVVCWLPFPPSMNHAWRMVDGKMLLSKGYRAYKKAVGDAVLEHRIKRHWSKDRLAVGLRLHPPNKVDYDIDNKVKTVLDALAGAGVIENDRLIDTLIVQRSFETANGAVLVRIEEVSTLPGDLSVLNWFSWIDRMSAGAHVLPKDYEQTSIAL